MTNQYIEEFQKIPLHHSLNIFDKYEKSCKFINTGINKFDLLISHKKTEFTGLQFGKSYEVYGKSGTGKTTLLLQILSEALMKDIPVFFIDIEKTFYVNRLLQICPLDEKHLRSIAISQPSTIEETKTAFNYCINNMVQNSVIFVDSIGKLIRTHPNQLNRVQQMLDDLKTACIQNNSIMITTNQAIEYDNTVKPTGGKTIEQLFDWIIELRKYGYHRYFSVQKSPVELDRIEASIELLPSGFDKHRG